MNNLSDSEKVKWYEKRYGPVIGKRGSGNWKNLFRMPNIYEWTILFMIIMALFMAWAYNYDISTCREVLINLTSQKIYIQGGF